MEMEFKDNSRRRTLVLVVGVLLALGAGAAAFMLSSQGTDEPKDTIPTIDIVVAAQLIEARKEIGAVDLLVLTVPRDATHQGVFTDPLDVVGKIAAIPILPNQPITANMLESAVGVGQVDILEADETVAPDSPPYRAVSLTVPSDRAVAGLVADGQRVDIIATFPMAVTLPIDPNTGEPTATNPETGQPFTYEQGSSTKLMWLDVKIIAHTADSDLYVIRADLQTAEEIAQAQNQGAQFTMVLRPAVDTRDVDRSTYGETSDTLLTRYNFRVPETIDGVTYPQPIYFPSPFPAEPYIDLTATPSPTPDGALVEIPIDTEFGSPAPEASLQP